MTASSPVRHATAGDAQFGDPPLQARVRRILDRASARQRGPAPLLAMVRSARLGIEIAVGEPGLAFHAASVGKLATGALVLRLTERGALDLDAPVIETLGAERVSGLVAPGGRDRGAEVTARHLLAHTSGIPDAFEGRARGSSTVAHQITGEPGRRWTADDLLEHTRRFQRAVAGPGERFAYSDTGYALLSLLVSTVEQRPFESLIDSRLLAPLGLTQSWMPTLAPPPGAVSALAPIMLGGVDLSTAASLSVDSLGGGGIAFTPGDLAIFVEALHDGRVVSPTSLAAMSATPSRFRTGLHYGLAMMRVRFGEFSPFLRSLPDATGHLGVTAAHAWRIEPLDATVVLGLGSDRAMTRSFRLLIEIVRALSREDASIPTRRVI